MSKLGYMQNSERGQLMICTSISLYSVCDAKALKEHVVLTESIGILEWYLCFATIDKVKFLVILNQLRLSEKTTPKLTEMSNPLYWNIIDVILVRIWLMFTIMLNYKHHSLYSTYRESCIILHTNSALIEESLCLKDVCSHQQTEDVDMQVERSFV